MVTIGACMSPMLTPQYEQHLQDLIRKANREGTLHHRAPAPGRAAARDHADLPDPGLLDQPIQDRELRLAVMRAHRAWAKVHAPWLLEEWLDGCS